jgi:alpha-L-rhamnosidase
VEQGATTMWEHWDGSASQNHIMFGDVVAWFYKALAGINPDPAAPGFKHFFITPQVVGDLTSARGEYDSIRGKIVSDWKVAKGEFVLSLTIPANTSATVSLPVSNGDLVEENGKPVARSAGITFLGNQGGRSLFTLESGEYRFSGPLGRQQ